MNNKALIELVLRALDAVKAEDVTVLEVSQLTSISDYMIIASGRSKRQVVALADKVVAVAKENAVTALGVEGRAEGEWVLVDFGDIIVHVMYPETREYYQLEKLWSAIEDNQTMQLEN